MFEMLNWLICSYLCGYIYYSSLLIDRTRTAFIHVPMLNKPFSAAQMAAGIRIAMVEMLKLVPGLVGLHVWLLVIFAKKTVSWFCLDILW